MKNKTPQEIREKKRRIKEKLEIRNLKKKIIRENKSLPKKADDLWSKVVRKVGFCAVCGKKEHLNAHHIFTRHNKSTRWDLDNGICLCSGCHVFSDTFSAHKCPTEFTYWLEQQFSREYLEILGQKARKPMKVTPEFLQDKITELKNILKTYE